MQRLYSFLIHDYMLYHAASLIGKLAGRTCLEMNNFPSDQIYLKPSESRVPTCNIHSFCWINIYLFHGRLMP